jgi:hypothetical protein
VGELGWIADRTTPAGLIVHACLVGLRVFSLGGLAGAFIFGAYLAGMSWLGYLTNNGYSAVDGQDHKGFLRFRIDKDGGLTAWFIALDRVPRRWRRNEGARPAWVADDETASASRVRDRFKV